VKAEDGFSLETNSSALGEKPHDVDYWQSRSAQSSDSPGAYEPEPSSGCVAGVVKGPGVGNIDCDWETDGAARASPHGARSSCRIRPAVVTPALLWPPGSRIYSEGGAGATAGQIRAQTATRERTRTFGCRCCGGCRPLEARRDRLGVTPWTCPASLCFICLVHSRKDKSVRGHLEFAGMAESSGVTTNPVE
jgi:hypothetical protein